MGPGLTPEHAVSKKNGSPVGREPGVGFRNAFPGIRQLGALHVDGLRAANELTAARDFSRTEVGKAQLEPGVRSLVIADGLPEVQRTADSSAPIPSFGRPSSTRITTDVEVGHAKDGFRSGIAS